MRIRGREIDMNVMSDPDDREYPRHFKKWEKSEKINKVYLTPF